MSFAKGVVLREQDDALGIGGLRPVGSFVQQLEAGGGVCKVVESQTVDSEIPSREKLQLDVTARQVIVRQAFTSALDRAKGGRRTHSC